MKPSQIIEEMLRAYSMGCQGVKFRGLAALRRPSSRVLIGIVYIKTRLSFKSYSCRNKIRRTYYFYAIKIKIIKHYSPSDRSILMSIALFRHRGSLRLPTLLLIARKTRTR